MTCLELPVLASSFRMRVKKLKIHQAELLIHRHWADSPILHFENIFVLSMNN